MEKILVMAWNGAGKTELEKRYTNNKNIRSIEYKYIYDKERPPEIQKCIKDRAVNPEWPKNFLDAVKANLGKTIVVISFDVRLSELYQMDDFKETIRGSRIIVVCPHEDNFDEYERRYLSRGNSKEFIEDRRKDFPRTLALLGGMRDYEKITLKPGQYLADALRAYGLELDPVQDYAD